MKREPHLRYISGLYVAEFLGRTKLGMTGNGLRYRLRAHARAGATRVMAYPLTFPVRYSEPFPLGKTEDHALELASRTGTRIGKSESFTFSFDEGVELMRAAITDRHGAPVEQVEVPIADLLFDLPHPLYARNAS